MTYANESKVALNFTPSSKSRAYCRASVDSALYTETYGNPGLWKLRSAEFLGSMFEFGRYLQKNITQDKMNGTQKYLKKNSGVMPKYIAYFTHSEIMAAWLKALGYDLTREVRPAGSIFFEFFRNETTTTAPAYARIFLKEFSGTDMINAELK